MIKITRGDVPKKIAKTIDRLTEELKKKYLNGERTFTFSSAYRSNQIKDALRKYQNNKCCFSEAKFEGDDAHVEHFRPKGRVDEWPSGTSLSPGYYWLAYAWSNLLLCKSTINCSYKRNYFPLETGTARNRSHLDNNIERPLLINPYIDEPREHIRFREDEPIALTERGRACIDLLHLRHPEFEEARRTRLRILKKFKNSVDKALEKGYSIDEPEIADVIDELKEAVQPRAPFSSMAIDFLQDWPHIQ